MKMINSEEVEAWLFEHANVQGHRCDSIKAPSPEDASDDINVAWIDTVTGEGIDIVYSGGEST